MKFSEKVARSSLCNIFKSFYNFSGSGSETLENGPYWYRRGPEVEEEAIKPRSEEGQGGGPNTNRLTRGLHGSMVIKKTRLVSSRRELVGQ
jgi:hypothetical protein